MSKGLYQAVLDGRYRQVQLLVSSGLSVNVPNELGQNPLVAALHINDERKRKKMFSYLCRHGGNCAVMDRSTMRDLFTWTCFLDRTSEALFVMKDQGGSLDFRRKDATGRTALHYCAVNGNVTIMDKIVEYMSNYGISVDIRDVDGFTPYILSLRMGHRTCADILRKGGASPKQMDTKNLRSCDDWAWVSDREKSFMVHKSNDKKKAMYKMLGRLPELKKAKFDTTNVRIVESRKDKNFLTAKETEIPARKSNEMFRQKTWLDFNKTRAKQLSKSLPNFQTAAIIEEEPSIKPQPKTPKPLAMQNAKQLRALDLTLALLQLNSSSAPTSNGTSSHTGSDISMAGNMKDIMKLLEQQCTGSYRPNVKPPPPPPTKDKGKHHHHKGRRSSRQLDSSLMAKKYARKLASREKPSGSRRNSLFPSIVEEK